MKDASFDERVDAGKIRKARRVRILAIYIDEKGSVKRLIY